MKISYRLIKKIHLYACLMTAALLIMFVLTSYLMIHRDWFDHELQSDTTTLAINLPLEQEASWQQVLADNEIQGRLTRNLMEDDGRMTRQYARAAGWTVLRTNARRDSLSIIRHTESTADALEGIHRQRGYGGPWRYHLYAFLLDLTGLSLILFTLTGIVLWLKLLKNDRIAWLIFLAGLVYVSMTLWWLMHG